MNFQALTACLLLACSTVLLANPDRPPPDPESRFERLAAELSLTDVQRPQVRALMQQHRAQMRSLHDQDRASRESAAADIDTGLEQVLTPEQMQRWREHRKANRPSPHVRPAGKNRRPR